MFHPVEDSTTVGADLGPVLVGSLLLLVAVLVVGGADSAVLFGLLTSPCGLGSLHACSPLLVTWLWS